MIITLLCAMFGVSQTDSWKCKVEGAYRLVPDASASTPAVVTTKDVALLSPSGEVKRHIVTSSAESATSLLLVDEYLVPQYLPTFSQSVPSINRAYMQHEVLIAETQSSFTIFGKYFGATFPLNRFEYSSACAISADMSCAAVLTCGTPSTYAQVFSRVESPDGTVTYPLSSGTVVLRGPKKSEVYIYRPKSDVWFLNNRIIAFIGTFNDSEDTMVLHPFLSADGVQLTPKPEDGHLFLLLADLQHGTTFAVRQLSYTIQNRIVSSSGGLFQKAEWLYVLDKDQVLRYSIKDLTALYMTVLTGSSEGAARGSGSLSTMSGNSPALNRVTAE